MNSASVLIYCMLQKLCERPSFKEMSIRAMEELAMVVRKVFGNGGTGNGGKESFWQVCQPMEEDLVKIMTKLLTSSAPLISPSG